MSSVFSMYQHPTCSTFIIQYSTFIIQYSTFIIQYSTFIIVLFPLAK